MSPNHGLAADDDALVRRHAALVGFDTQNPSGDERPLVEHLARELTALGGRTEVLPVGRHASVYARFGAETPTLLVNAHVDTVPANHGYTRPPHTLTREGDRLFGLGAADTKGAIAATLDAIAALNASGRPPHGVAVLFSGDEEVAGTCVRAFLAGGRASGIERAIACEPTRCRVGTRHRGIVAASVGATSPGGHSSRADALPSPVAVLARVATALDELAKRNRTVGPPGYPGLCLNLAGVEGGVAFNVIPASAELVLSLRPAPGTDVAALLDELEALARKAAAPDPITWRIDHHNPPFATRDVRRFQTLLDARGEPPADLAFWTEAALFAEAGIDAVVFGPGAIEQAHAADEFVDLPELVLARDTLVRLLAP
jgi:acetylornithine deacetylase